MSLLSMILFFLNGLIIPYQDMSGEAETSSEPTLAPALPLAASFAEVSPASVLQLTRITEDYLCPPQVRYMGTRLAVDRDKPWSSEAGTNSCSEDNTL